MKFKGGPGMMGGGMGMQNLMRQANQLQNKIKKAQEELAARTYEGSAGGDAVKVQLKGEEKVTSLQIKKDVMEAGDIEMLQDLIIAAVNDALKNARDTRTREMESLTGGLQIPGLF